MITTAKEIHLTGVWMYDFDFYVTDVGVCVNYEVRDDDTVLGVFTCPHHFEPETFTACCGYEYAEFCCEYVDEV